MTILATIMTTLTLAWLYKEITLLRLFIGLGSIVMDFLVMGSGLP